MSGDLDGRAVARAYGAWAPVYDVLCGPIQASGRRAAAMAASRVGGRILEIGVGTGLSFGDYGSNTDIIGIDFSARMIAQAQKRAASGAYPQVKSLLMMDAHRLAFSAGSFDCAVLTFVITLVTQPERVLSECARVVRGGGEIIVVSHLYSESGIRAGIDRWLARPCALVGLRPDFPFQRFVDWAHAEPGMEILERRSIRSFGAYTLVRIRRC
jgi:phosphatidylethanolamine/phosphatidyl-N-methylethanolamine N-methyltransferase